MSDQETPSGSRSRRSRSLRIIGIVTIVAIIVEFAASGMIANSGLRDTLINACPVSHAPWLR